jgi:branched-chain amino acid transport system substrate-binding protein
LAKKLAKERGGEINGVIVTQVVPHPSDDIRDIVRKYQDDIGSLENTRDQENTRELSFGGLEGYISAEIFLVAAKSIDVEITRDNLVDAFEQLNSFDIGLGHNLHLSKDDHPASSTVWPTVLKHGEFVPFEWSQIESLLK